MRKDHVVTTAQVLEKVKNTVAPLPSQKEYMKNLAMIMNYQKGYICGLP